MKKCTKCQRIKEECHFYKMARSKKDGRMPWCIRCTIENTKKWNRAHKEEHRAYNREKKRKEITAKYTPVNIEVELLERSNLRQKRINTEAGVNFRRR